MDLQTADGMGGNKPLPFSVDMARLKEDRKEGLETRNVALDPGDRIAKPVTPYSLRSRAYSPKLRSVLRQNVELVLPLR